MSDRPKELICVMPTKYDEFKPFPGSQRINPDCCGQECWIGPAQRAFRQQFGVVVVCIECCVQRGYVNHAELIALTDH